MVINLFSNVSYSFEFLDVFKHSITFKNVHPLNCWFHSAGIFYIKFRFCKTFTVINFVTRNLLIEMKYCNQFRTIKSWFYLLPAHQILPHFYFQRCTFSRRILTRLSNELSKLQVWTRQNLETLEQELEL